MVSQSVVVCLALLAAASATDVHQCPGKSVENLSSKVQLNPCKKLPCRLKKGTNQQISIDFTPDKDIDILKNRVTANVFGLDVPFVGVDGSSVCEKVYTESGEKANCPLKSGTAYTYKDSFPVLSIYPSLQTEVHWALVHGNNDLVCFRVPVRIA